jgi:hypothetical protein
VPANVAKSTPRLRLPDRRAILESRPSVGYSLIALPPCSVAGSPTSRTNPPPLPSCRSRAHRDRKLAICGFFIAHFAKWGVHSAAMWLTTTNWARILLPVVDKLVKATRSYPKSVFGSTTKTTAKWNLTSAGSEALPWGVRRQRRPLPARAGIGGSLGEAGASSGPLAQLDRKRALHASVVVARSQSGDREVGSAAH